MKMIFEIVCYPGPAMTIVHRKECQLWVAFKVGEGCAPILVCLLVPLHV